MKAASSSEIKQALINIPPKKVIEICLRLARFKKENKELLSYLLFDAQDELSYLERVKKEMDEQFLVLPNHNWYLTKKALRKILKAINRYSKQMNTKECEVEMIMHFCFNLKKSTVRFRSYKVLSSLYDQQLKKLNLLIQQVHEDLRFDYSKQLNQLME